VTAACSARRPALQAPAGWTGTFTNGPGPPHGGGVPLTPRPRLWGAPRHAAHLQRCAGAVPRRAAAPQHSGAMLRPGEQASARAWHRRSCVCAPVSGHAQRRRARSRSGDMEELLKGRRRYFEGCPTPTAAVWHERGPQGAPSAAAGAGPGRQRGSAPPSLAPTGVRRSGTPQAVCPEERVGWRARERESRLRWLVQSHTGRVHDRAHGKRCCISAPNSREHPAMLRCAGRLTLARALARRWSKR
jgi:hypothetical protein